MKMFIAALTGAAWVGASLAQPISPSEFGATPSIVAAKRTLLPTVAIAPVKGWGKDEAPHAADGIKVTALVRGLQHPRWLYVLPNGDILIAEAEAPRKPDDNKGLSGKVHTEAMMRAGSGTAPSANRITLLRYTDGDAGKLERHVFLHGLNSPIGMALVGDTFYVADSDALLSVPYHAGDTEIHDEPVRLTDLPAGSINHHWTKSLLASPDGAKLYVGVGSNSNAAENGLAVESERAAVWEIDRGTGSHRIYASGLRNPVGLAWEPTSGVLWVAVNERDELGDQVPPDYMTGLRDGAFYGWPFSYYGQHVDPRVKPQNPGLVASAIPPDYALGGHTASLGLCWSDGSKLPEPFKNGMFVGQHGSWNRRIRSGYKVVFVRFTDGKPTGQPIDVLTGFLSAKNEALGRPVGVAVDKQGALLVADDVGNTVWRLTDARGSSGVSGGS